MASLRKDPRGNSPYWYACISIPGKGQTQRSTRVKASERLRGEAMAVAERMERQAKLLAAAGNLQNRDAVLEAFVTATQKAAAGNMTEASARDVLDQILQAAGQSVNLPGRNGTGSIGQCARAGDPAAYRGGDGLPSGH